MYSRKYMPTRKWLMRCFRSYEEAGGWIGVETVKALKPYICELYRRGATAEAAGKAAADYYRLHAATATLQEYADIRSD